MLISREFPLDEDIVWSAWKHAVNTTWKSLGREILEGFFFDEEFKIGRASCRERV
jgi:hypothetical protein